MKKPPENSDGFFALLSGTDYYGRASIFRNTLKLPVC